MIPDDQQITEPTPPPEPADLFIGPPIPPWPFTPEPPRPMAQSPTPREQFRTRLKLLVLAGVVGPLVMVLVGAAFAWFVRGEPLWTLLTQFDPPLVILAGAGLCAGGSMGLISLLHRSNKTFARALRRSGSRVAEETLQIAGYPVMLVVVAMAGLGEELLFRGGLQPTIGLFPAALLFGFSHGGWRKEMWAYVVAATGAGLVYGLAYQWTGLIWIPVVGHAAHNVISVLAIGWRLDITFERGRLRVRWVKETEEEQE